MIDQNQLTGPHLQPPRKTLFAPWSAGPLIGTAICLVIWIFTVNSPALGFVSCGAGAAFFLGILYFLVQFFGRLVHRQWLGAFFAVIRIVVCVVAFFPAFFYAIFVLGGWGDTDHFADKLTIPTNIVISKPIESDSTDSGGKDDQFQAAIITSLQKPAGQSAAIVPSVPSLRNLITKQRPLLMQYLESSPAWRVYDDHGQMFATRRWQQGTRWTPTLNGYYNDFRSATSTGNGGPQTSYQTRTRLDFNGTDLNQKDNWIDEGTSRWPVVLKPSNVVDSSTCLIRCGDGVILEIFDQSPGPGRRITEAALAQIESECQPIMEHMDFDPTLLPTDSIQHGNPSLNLYESIEPGIYDAESWVNPGEPGTVYLKAYEITKNQQLSATELNQSSNERIGWSKNPQELFLSATNNTIYEGDWGHPYAARFELWFKPDSGCVERKLVERNFVIEGWER